MRREDFKIGKPLKLKDCSSFFPASTAPLDRRRATTFCPEFWHVMFSQMAGLELWKMKKDWKEGGLPDWLERTHRGPWSDTAIRRALEAVAEQKSYLEDFHATELIYQEMADVRPHATLTFAHEFMHGAVYDLWGYAFKLEEPFNTKKYRLNSYPRRFMERFDEMHAEFVRQRTERQKAAEQSRRNRPRRKPARNLNLIPFKF